MYFEKFANSYSQYNLIQKKIIKKYIVYTKEKIIDLGCGSEGLCKYKNFEFYLGIDKSKKMLSLNPCHTLLLDFNNPLTWQKLKKYNYEQIVSFSALQWATDLEFIFNEIKKQNKSFLVAIFTSNTFKTLHSYLKITSPIYSKEDILKFSKILNPSIHLYQDKLYFNNPLSLLKYIKFSGVKGKIFANPYLLKKFIKEFPFNYLEFEVVIIGEKGLLE
jgi:malonyl-CoA O-methyltransferase